MSTLKVSAIQSPSTTDGGLAISATGAVSGALPVPNRNLLYNGAMQVAQRGTSFTASGYTLDRWSCVVGGTTTFTQDSSDVPSGFVYALKWATSASSSFGQVKQFLERADVYRLRGQSLTLSWWCKASSGYSGSQVAQFYYSNASDASASVTTQVGSNQTITPTTSWVQYTATTTVPADAVGFAVFLVPDVVQASGVTVSITGVQLETGPVATEFEHRSYGDELARCQRYYQVLGKITNTPLLMGAVHSTSVARGSITFPEMRTAPTTVTFPVMLGLNATNGSAGTASMSASAVTANSLYYTGTGMTGLTAGNATIFQTQDANGLRLSAEL